MGNPPYVKVHHLSPSIRNFLKNNYRFCAKGMIDIYLAFYEMGIQALHPEGALVFITPNMFMRNTSNQDFRNFLIQKNLLHSVIDFKSEKIFEGISTYNCIIKLQKNKINEEFNCYEGRGKEIIHYNTLKGNDFYNKIFVLGNATDMQFLQKKTNGKKLDDISNIQYGLCTLLDDIFITDNVKQIDDYFCLFKGIKIEIALVKKIIKGSKIKNKNFKILFPYEKIENRWVIIQENQLKTKYPLTYGYFYQHKDILLKRDRDKKTLWYEYGRSQGLQTIHKQKIVLDILVNGKINKVWSKKYSQIKIYSLFYLRTNTKKTRR